MKETLTDILSAVRGSDTILLCTHRQPDGDAAGSLLAMGEFLASIGKKSLMLCHDRVPEHLRFLPGWEKVVRPPVPEGLRFDLGIALDSSDEERLGDAAGYFSACPRTAQIDHHATNSLSAGLSAVSMGAAATGSLVFRLIREAGVPLSQTMAICLYTAISTDTGNFCFGAVSRETFSQMADLMRAGLPLVQTARWLHLIREPKQVRLLGRALVSLSFFCGGRATRMRLTAEDFSSCGANAEHADGLVNHGLYMPGVEICYLATETPEGIRCSLRCVAPHNVAAIAAAYGGGGHELAAGCLLREPMDAAAEKLDRSILAVLGQ